MGIRKTPIFFLILYSQRGSGENFSYRGYLEDTHFFLCIFSNSVYFYRLVTEWPKDMSMKRINVHGPYPVVHLMARHTWSKKGVVQGGD